MNHEETNGVARVFPEAFARELVSAATITKADVRIARINYLTDQLAELGLVRPRTCEVRKDEWAHAKSLNAWMAAA